MVTQYPHTITLSIKKHPVQDELTGYFTEGDVTVYTFACRAEKNTAGRLIPGKDGTQLIYDYVVYMPPCGVDVPRDTPYRLQKGSLTVSGYVKGAENGQLNSRLWL